jgi:peptide-methionine (R)-S-oxide reductase
MNRKKSVASLLAIGFGATLFAAYDPPKEGSQGKKEEASTNKTLTSGGTNDSIQSKTEQDSSERKSSKSSSKKMTGPQYNKLSFEEQRVILYKGTERPFSSKFTDYKVEGTYLCRRCNAPLYKSDDKFHSGCGWPSFDQEIKGAVLRQLESDGTGRIEIVCKNCGGHLGHVFEGEGFTAKNTRHCVNGVSMKFVAKDQPMPEVVRSDEKGNQEVSEESKKADAKTSSTSNEKLLEPGKKK